MKNYTQKQHRIDITIGVESYRQSIAIVRNRIKALKMKITDFNTQVDAIRASFHLVLMQGKQLLTETEVLKIACADTRLVNHSAIKDKLITLRATGRKFILITDEWKNNQPYILPLNDNSLNAEFVTIIDELNIISILKSEKKYKTQIMNLFQNMIKLDNELTLSFQTSSLVNIQLQEISPYIQLCFNTAVPIIEKAKNILHFSNEQDELTQKTVRHSIKKFKVKFQ